MHRIVKNRLPSFSKHFKLIEPNKWDYVVLQDHSKAPISGRHQMIKAAEVLVKINKENKAIAVLIITFRYNLRKLWFASDYHQE